ncbi:unnamed protein product [Toxocara canis]|uniref:Uncharacterized protein n=1 Tax=Toxocara canis TaxID=6265 RepID=A0A183UDX0_TOXCA|nr:unnamed protein product [Toxocara canis]
MATEGNGMWTLKGVKMESNRCTRALATAPPAPLIYPAGMGKRVRATRGSHLTLCRVAYVRDANLLANDQNQNEEPSAALRLTGV